MVLTVLGVVLTAVLVALLLWFGSDRHAVPGDDAVLAEPPVDRTVL